MIAGACPSMQLDNQNDAFFPLRTVTLVAAANKAASTSSTDSSIPSKGCSGLVHANHSHLKRGALLKFFPNSVFLIPPKYKGLATNVHATLHSPM